MRVRFGIMLVTAAVFAAMATPARAAMSVVANAPVSWGPSSFAIDPVTGLVYAGSVTDDAAHGIVSQISVIAGTQVVTTIKRAGLNPVGLALDVAQRRLYVSSQASNKVYEYSTATNAVSNEVSIPSGGPWGIDIDQQSGRVWVADFNTNKVTVIERAGGVSTVDLAPSGCAGPAGVAFNSARAEVFVTCLYSGTVHVLSAVTSAVTTTVSIGLGSYPWGVASDPNGDMVYVANWRGGTPTAGTVSVINASTNAIIATAYTGGAPIGVAVSTLGTPYVTLSATNKLAALTAGTGAIAEVLPLPVDPVDGKNEPHAVAINPTGRLAYVGNYHAESVAIVNTLPYL